MLFDVIVLGNGRAACQGAIEAARHGLHTLLVPHAAQKASEGALDPARAIRLFGDTQALSELERLRPQLGGKLPMVYTALRQLHALEVERASQHLQQAGVEVESGSGASFVGLQRLRMRSGRLLEAPVILIATGDRPRRPPRFAFDDSLVCDWQTVLRSDRVPRKLVLVGAEATGCAIACLFALLGSKVALVERRAQLLRYVDVEIREQLQASMHEMGIELATSIRLDKVEMPSGDLRRALVHLADGRVLACDRLAIVAGSAPNVEGLGLDSIGVARNDAGFVVIDESGQTSQKGVYAAGSVVCNLGDHPEAQQGRSAIRTALGLSQEVEQPVPLTVNSIPEISMVGLTEEVCRHLDIPYVSASAGFDEVAWGELRPDRSGILKLVANRDTGEILGVHVMGPGARDLVQLGAWVMRGGGTIGQLADTLFSSPSAAETYWTASLRALDQLARNRVWTEG